MAWLSDYSYRKLFSLSRPSGVVTNYQMKILVGESSGATTAHVCCDSGCASDFDDLRFTTSDGTTLLDYWIESLSGATPNQIATVWVEFNSIGIGPTQFCMYYGYAGAAAASSGPNTFPLFDHFDDASLSSTLWTDLGGVVESGTEVVVTADSNDNHGIRGKTFFDSSYAMRARVKPTHIGATYHENARFDDTDASDQLGAYFCHSMAAFQSKFGSYISPNYTTKDIAGDTAATYCIIDIMRNSTVDARYLIDGAGAQTITTYVTTANLAAMISTYGNGSIITADWVLVRRWYVIEPTFGCWQSEEVLATVPWVSGWRKRMKLTITGALVGETVANFPIMIQLTSASGIFDEIGSNNLKMSLRTSAAVECYVEIESWDSGSKLGTLWAKVPQLVLNNSIDLYLYYDGGHADNSSYVGVVGSAAGENVWESNYVLVWHLSETPGGAGTTIDSTTNDLDGTPGSGCSLVDGEFGKAYDLDASTNAYVSIADNALLDFTTILTMHAYINADALEVGTNVLIKCAAGKYSYGIDISTSYVARAWAEDNGDWEPSRIATDPDALTTGSWILLTGVYNGSTMTLYRNGVYKAISSSGAMTIYNSSGSFIAGYSVEFTKNFNGKMSLVTLESVARSAAYVLMFYKSVKNTLLSYGTEENLITLYIASRRDRLDMRGISLKSAVY